MRREFPWNRRSGTLSSFIIFIPILVHWDRHMSLRSPRDVKCFHEKCELGLPECLCRASASTVTAVDVFRDMAGEQLTRGIKLPIRLYQVEDTEVTVSKYEDFDVVNTSINDDRELKIGIKVSGGKTEAIFNQVFDRMIAIAQPIPGFRREKGGKTPNKQLRVGRNLKVEQSFEDLEATFGPGRALSFDAVLKLLD